MNIDEIFNNAEYYTRYRDTFIIFNEKMRITPLENYLFTAADVLGNAKIIWTISEDNDYTEVGTIGGQEIGEYNIPIVELNTNNRPTIVEINVRFRHFHPIYGWGTDHYEAVIKRKGLNFQNIQKPLTPKQYCYIYRHTGATIEELNIMTCAQGHKRIGDLKESMC